MRGKRIVLERTYFMSSPNPPCFGAAAVTCGLEVDGLMPETAHWVKCAEATAD